MQALNVPILLEPAAKNLDDSYLQIKQLGLATGHSAQADSLVASMRSQVGALVASVSKPARQVKVYHELDNTFYSVTSATFIGQAYKLLGLTNIADAATAATPDYPQLSPEFIVSSNPDLIVLADTKCCQQDLNSVAARPGWRAQPRRPQPGQGHQGRRVRRSALAHGSALFALHVDPVADLHGAQAHPGEGVGSEQLAV